LSSSVIIAVASGTYAFNCPEYDQLSSPKKVNY